MIIVDIGDHIVRRGDCFILPILGELDSDGALVNLGNYGPTWAAQVRPRPASEVHFDFIVNAANINGAVDDDEDAPQLTLSLTAAQTRDMTAETYVFDVAVSGGAAGEQTIYNGTLRMAQDVTR